MKTFIFLLILAITLHVKTRPVDCQHGVNTLLSVTKEAEPCGKDVCYHRCVSTEPGKTFNYFMTFRISDLFGKEISLQEAYKRVCVDQEFTKLTKEYHIQQVKKALKVFEDLVDEDTYEEEERRVKRIYTEATRTWQFYSDSSNIFTNQTQIRDRLKNSYELQYVYLQNLLDNYQEPMRRLIMKGLDGVRDEFIKRLLSEKLVPSFLFPQMYSLYRILGIIGTSKYPPYIGKLSVFDYLESMFKLWGEFESYCSKNGIQDIDIDIFEKFVQSLRKKYPKYPFPNNSKVKPLEPDTDDYEYLQKLEHEIIRVRNVIDTIFYSGRFCPCQGFIKMGESLILKATKSNKTNLTKKVKEYTNIYNQSIKEKCQKKKDTTRFSDKMGVDLLKDKAALKRLEEHLRQRLSLPPPPKKTSLTDQQFKKKFDEFKRIDEKITKIIEENKD